ncbi:FAD-dependent oxidoreductase, partial [Staphylococcus epidermidis]|uniref:FAD-dependent oxidoreductase n=1 Tax=Staphylococcus epidermidis TaxID=1282 RepID=UPI0037D9A3EF
MIQKDSINMHKLYFKSPYHKPQPAYLNSPITQEDFNHFYHPLLQPQVPPLNHFQKQKYFQPCIPFQLIPQTAPKTFLFPPVKPLALQHPNTPKPPYPLLQLTQHHPAPTLYNILGFQTHLK